MYRLNRLGAALAAAAMATAALVLPAAPAQATGNYGAPCVATTHTNLDGVEPTAPAPADAADAPAVELTGQGVKVTTRTFDGQGVAWTRTLDKPLALKYVFGAGYTTVKHEHAKVPEALPAMLLFIESPAGERATLVYEPYGNANGGAAAKQLGRRTWNTLAGKWWTSTNGWPAGDFPEEGGKRAPNPHAGLTLAQVAAENRGALVTGFGWRQNWAEGLVATVSDIKLAGKTAQFKKVCESHRWTKPIATFTDTCTTTKIRVEHTGTRGEWLVDVGAGDFTASHKLAPGEVAAEEFANTVGQITVKVYAGGKKLGKWRHTWTKPAQGCDASPSPSPSPSSSATPPPVPGGGAGGEEPGLPVTGPKALTLAGGALAAVVAGIILYVAARRRRVRFTT